MDDDGSTISAVYLLTVLLPRRFSSATFETEVIACLQGRRCDCRDQYTRTTDNFHEPFRASDTNYRNVYRPVSAAADPATVPAPFISHELGFQGTRIADWAKPP